MTKKVLSLLIVGCLCCSLLSFGLTATAESNGETGGAIPAEETFGKVYLVPGEYMDYETNQIVYNTVPGAQQLSADECSSLFIDGNVYLAGAEGSELPSAETEKKDGSGKDFVFNGWWAIEDDVVTYFDVVPGTTEDMYLYADFRAELSQPMNPIQPSESEKEDVLNYMSVKRAATGETEIIPLFVSATDVSNAVGSSYYGGPVQFYNEWFVLSPGDEVEYFVTGIYGSEPQIAPQIRAQRCNITLEISGVSNTASWLGHKNITSGQDYMTGKRPTLYYKGTEEHHFRVYIKFYDEGGTMTIYMENMDK